jgi:hypothetical protein
MEKIKEVVKRTDPVYFYLEERYQVPGTYHYQYMNYNRICKLFDPGKAQTPNLRETYYEVCVKSLQHALTKNLKPEEKEEIQSKLERLERFKPYL